MRKAKHESKSAIWWTLAVLLASLLAVPVHAAKVPFPQIVVFGTSLSDPGNRFALTGGNNVPPSYREDFLLVPDAAYARGGHHLSDGATWIEQAAQALKVPSAGRPAFRGSSAATNYAVDGARAYVTSLGGIVDFPEQVDFFLQDVGQAAPSDALYVIEIGSNDAFDAFRAFLAQQDGGPILQAALSSYAIQLQRLYAAGARHFIVLSVPDISLTPAVRKLDTVLFPQQGIAQLASNLAQGFNAGLTGIVTQFDALAGVDVTTIDTFQLVDEIVAANGNGFGLTNVTDACIMPDTPPFQCQNRREYLFWDGIHPAQAGHGIIAQRVVSILMQ